MLDFHWITDHLAVGARFPMALAEALARTHRVQCVVDVREECCDDERVLRRVGVELLHLPTPDMLGISVEQIDAGVNWIAQRIDRGQRVLVHCEHGVGRSTLLCCCVLVHGGMQPLEAVRLAKSKRRELAFSLEQQQRFVEWCSRRAEGRGMQVPTPVELQEIVWA